MDLSSLSKQLNLNEKELRQKVYDAGIRLSPRARKVDNYLARQIMDALKPKPKIDPNAPKIIKKVSLPAFIKVKDYVDLLGMSIQDVIKSLLKNGVMANINEEIDYDTAAIVATELGFDVSEEQSQSNAEMGASSLQDTLKKEDESTLKHRPPIVAIMGHVDHGKTSLIDFIRKTNVVGGEAGAITQHIGAYQVKKNGKFITILDTPGHEAFSEMRARGANVTDLIILVVAADDGVKPQTIEVINRAKFTNTPIIVAVNKIDKEGANITRVKQELAEHGVLTEDWGGKTIAVPISAKTGEGIDDLLEMILLTADVENFRANPNGQALGTVIESHLSQGKGPVATVIIQNGSLKVGDIVTIGGTFGRVRALEDELGKKLKEATPSMPAQISGISDVPQTGDILTTRATLDEAKSIAFQIQRKERVRKINQNQRIKGDSESKTLNLIIKSDVLGSLEAIKQSIDKLKNEEVTINIISEGAGEITENDVTLASASKSTIIGFNTKANVKAMNLAKQQKVVIDLYDIIYELIEDVTTAVVKMLSPELIKTSFGRAKILKVFMTDKGSMIIGGRVEDGMIKKAGEIAVLRKNAEGEQEEIGRGEILDLQQSKIMAKEVVAGNEFGMKVKTHVKIVEGDMIESFEEKLKAKDFITSK
ncbi:MAG: infB [Candidatus Doudnabacteria bacterium]|nr:infB [Candidatus Doudnabacteria bacterium]